MINYPFVTAMVFNTPLYATPEIVSSVKAVLMPRMISKEVRYDSSASMPSVHNTSDTETMRIVEKVAIISVHGILVSRRGAFDEVCQLVSYESLRTTINVALNDEAVKEIVLDFDTGGGSAAGCMECADFIRSSTSIKPITAIVNFSAYSAGYFLASACSRIIASPTGGIGSVGVMIETVEYSKFEDELGINFNTFYRGSHKNDASPHEEITDQTIVEINSRLDIAYDQFVSSVSSYRGLDKQVIIDTQARSLSPSEALSLQCIDGILPAQDAVNQIAKKHMYTPSPSTIRARATVINIASKR